MLLTLRSKFVQYKTVFFYTGSSIIKSFAVIIVGFVIARFVSPEDLGIWSSINLLLNYSMFCQAGLINGLNLELPYLIGKNDNKTAMELAGASKMVVILSSVFVIFIGVLFFLFYTELNDKYKYGILVMSFIIGITFYQNYLTSTFRSKNSFEKLSLIQIVDSIFNVVTLFLVVYYSYYGLLFKSLLVIIVYVFILHVTRPLKVKSVWNINGIIRLVKIGFPIFILAYIENTAFTMDRLILIKYSNLVDLGLYSFALYALSLFSLFSSSVATYIYPRMTYNYACNGDKLYLWIYAKKVTLLLLVLQLPLAIIGVFSLNYIVPLFFPNYVDSITAMQILLFAGVFKGSVVGVNALWSVKCWRYMISYQLLFSLFLCVFPFLFFKYICMKIEFVALGILVACFVNLFSGIYFTYKGLRVN